MELLYKVGPLKNVMYKLKNHYKPSKNIALDETIIPFYGRCKFTQYNNMKSDKLGFKTFS